MSKNLKSQQPNLKDKLETKVKSTEQLLACAVIGRLLDSYWKAGNTAVSIKEFYVNNKTKT